MINILIVFLSQLVFGVSDNGLTKVGKDERVIVNPKGFKNGDFDKIRQKMGLSFGDFLNGSFLDFGPSMKDQSSIKILNREDEKYKYFDIITKDIENPNFNINIDKKYVTISGKIEHKEEVEREGQRTVSQYYSTFTRSVGVPENVDPTKASVENKKDKIVIKFPRI